MIEDRMKPEKEIIIESEDSLRVKRQKKLWKIIWIGIAIIALIKIDVIIKIVATLFFFGFKFLLFLFLGIFIWKMFKKL